MAKYVVQAAFLVWSIFLYLAFLHAAYKVDHLLRTMPSSMLTRDNINAHQKGSTFSMYISILIYFLLFFFNIWCFHIPRFHIVSKLNHSYSYDLGIMQLAILAPYSNLATSVAAALVPTLLGPKMKGPEESESANANKSAEEATAEEGSIISLYHFSSRCE